MEMASFTGFVKTLLYIILGYYALKFLMRVFAPILVQKTAQKVHQKMEEQMRNQQNAYKNTQQSQNTTQKEMPKEKKKVGEYVDFEEID